MSIREREGTIKRWTRWFNDRLQRRDMKTEEKPTNLLALARKDVRDARQALAPKDLLIHDHARELILLPWPPTSQPTISVFSDSIAITYWGTDAEVAREIAGQVRAVLAVKSERQTWGETTTFLMRRGKMKVTVYGADLAPGCELVPYEETVTLSLIHISEPTRPY